MDKDKNSYTEHELYIEEQLAGDSGHYKTSISDGDKKVEGYGKTSEESQKNASEKWDKK